MFRVHKSLAPFAFLALASPTLIAQTYERVDVNDQGQLPNSSPGAGDISDDGRFVAFTSTATNFGGTDVAGTWDVFLRDCLLGTTTRITTSLTGAQSINPTTTRISGDGSKVAFMRGGTSPSQPSRAFLYERLAGTFTEILAPGLTDIRVDALNLDGNYAVIATPGSSAPTSSPQYIYRLNLTTGALILCGRDMNGNPVSVLAGQGASAIDDDGTHVAFTSHDPNIVPGDTNGTSDVFVYDIPGNLMLLASVAQGGGSSNGLSNSASISGNGRYVAFASSASNLDVLDNDSVADVFVRDLRLGTTRLASLYTSQAPFDLSANLPLLSPDASSVAFATSYPINAGDTGSGLDTFLRDIDAGALLEVSHGSSGFLEGTSHLALTRDGREVLVGSSQSALGVSTSQSGLFVAKFGPRCSSSGYCTSLPNSTGQAATIGAQGDASLQLNNLVISAVGLPATANAMLVSGTSAVDPGTPFGNGLMCIGGTLIRHGVHVAIGGVILDAQDVHSAEYVGVNPGDTRYYQVVYRDPAAGGALFNTTDAVAVTFCW